MKKIIYFIIIFVSIFVLSNRINAWSKYEIGKKVEYNGNDYYVIKNSDENNDTVTMLKAEPLSVEEVNTYGGVGTEHNHVNMYATSDTSAINYQKADNQNGYGGMAYYTSPTCGYPSGGLIESGCKMNYESSEIKYVVDAWADDNFDDGLVEARLISIDEIRNNYTIEQYKPCGDGCGVIGEKITADTPWMFNSDYVYWTMSVNPARSNSVWSVGAIGSIDFSNVHNGNYYHNRVVRPLIVVKKSALGDIDDTKDGSNNETNTINNKNETSSVVRVPNTLEKISIIFIMIGIVIISIGIIIVVKNKDIIRKK